MRFIRKLKHIIGDKIPNYYFRRYPYLVEFIKSVYEFLDKDSAIDVLNFTRNLDTERIYDKFVTFYYKQHANEIIDQETYSLTQNIKRRFLDLAQFFYQSKGKKLSMDLTLSYLNEYYDYEDGEYIQNLDYVVSEVVDNWFSTDVERYKRPYTYFVDLTESHHPMIREMITNLNPVGFQPLFRFHPDIEDTYNLYPTQETLTAYILNKTPFSYNGVHSYNGVSHDLGVFDELQYKGYWYKPDPPDVLTN